MQVATGNHIGHSLSWKLKEKQESPALHASAFNQRDRARQGFANDAMLEDFAKSALVPMPVHVSSVRGLLTVIPPRLYFALGATSTFENSRARSALFVLFLEPLSPGMSHLALLPVPALQIIIAFVLDAEWSG